jgi:hypothetical protein
MIVHAGAGRRAFLCRGAAALAGLLTASLGACGGAAERERIARRLAELDPDLDCSAAPRLWPAEVKTRADNAYVDRSTRPGEHCFTCANFIEPHEPRACGACRTVKGPVHPAGWCKSWTRRAA